MTPSDWTYAHRQWRRAENVQHAVYRKNTSQQVKDIVFWTEVLALFGVE